MDNIPKEIYSIIASFLDDASKRAMRLASTQWFNIIQYDYFHFYYTKEEQFEEICNRLKKYKFPIGVKFSHREKVVLEKRHYDMLGQITQLNQLFNTVITRQTPLEDLWALTNLTNLETTYLPAEITAHLPNLKSFSITTEGQLQVSHTLSKLESIVYSLDDYAVSKYAEDLQLLPHPLKLTKLTWMGNPPEQKLDTVNCHLTKLSNLKELWVMDGSWFDWQELPNTWNIPTLPNLEVLMMNGLANIQSISLSNTKLTQVRVTGDKVDCGNFTTFTNLEILGMDGKISNLSGLRSLTKLKGLVLRLANSIEDTFRSMTDFEFLSQLNNLKEFEISSSIGGRKWSEVMKYFSENNNLTKIIMFGSDECVGSHATKFQKLQSFDCYKIDEESSYHMTAFTNLTNLYIGSMSPTIFPSLANLTTLKSLACYINEEPNSNAKNLDFGNFLNLEKLTVNPQDGDDIVFSGFHELTRLTSLAIHLPEHESVFDEISQCTSLVELQLGLNILDNQILKLTNLTKLRKLGMVPEGEFTGVNLTCLTFLQALDVYSQHLVVTSTTLRQKLPNLRLCNLH